MSNQGEAADSGDEGNGCFAGFLAFLSMLLIVVTFPISIWGCVKVVQVREE